MNVLNMIRNKDKNYFIENVRISSTFSPDLSICDRYKFFNTDPIVKDLGISTSRLSIHDTKYFDGIEIDDQANEEQIDFIYDQLRIKLKQNEKLSGFELNFLNTIEDIEKQISATKWSTLAGTCLFNARLYIDVEGRFHLCERINNNFPVGNVVDGPDFEKMNKMAIDFKEIVCRHCRNCEARHFCKICFAEAMGGEGFAITEQYCNQIKKNLQFRLEKYIEFKKENLLYKNQ